MTTSYIAIKVHIDWHLLLQITDLKDSLEIFARPQPNLVSKEKTFFNILKVFKMYKLWFM